MAAAAGPADEDPFAHTRMTLGEHLDELRQRLFIGVLAVALAFGVSLYFSDALTAVILHPFHEAVARLNEHFPEEARAKVRAHPELQATYFEPDGTYRFPIESRLQALAPTESMWFVLKVAGYFALFLGSPVLLWQLWQFVAAGLYKRERSWVVYFFPPALLLFLVGVLFSYFVLVPFGLFYVQQSTPIEEVKPGLGLEFYFSFLSTLCFSMGLVFQLPILMTFLGLVGIVPAATFARARAYFVVVAFVIAAFLTPGPDVFSQVAMATPMIVLYEIGILGARLAARRRGTASVA